MARDYNFWVYFLTNRNHRVLYLGVTNALSRRVCEHRRGAGAGFTRQFRCNKPIYYSHFSDVRDAIAREKQLRKWSRAKKMALIGAMNPRWLDLGAELLDIIE